MTLLAVYCAGYYSLNELDLASTRLAVSSPLDRAIPFSPRWIWIYLSAPAVFLSPVILVRSRSQWRHVVSSYAWILAIHFAFFWLFPCSLPRLHPMPAFPESLAFEFLYGLDRPGNCFPSLHVAMVFAAAWIVRIEAPATGALMLAAASLISVSTLFVKQHTLADVVAGFAAAWAVTLLCARRAGN
ncbi:MAG: phosphatase PAP2 family protein [Candidatus Wallbacteria bacterium]|nr:phosphatase PAP2 family protein [Candidatus Wallbacteria bacterium]